MSFSPRVVVIALLICGVGGGEVDAIKKRLTPAQKYRIATHVVTGRVTKVYEREEQKPKYHWTLYVAEVRVDEVEKGQGVSDRQLIYVRYWRRKWVGEGRVPPGTSGYHPIPVDGQAVRIYLARNSRDGASRENNDGGFNVLGMDGFEILEPQPDATADDVAGETSEVASP